LSGDTVSLDGPYNANIATYDGLGGNAGDDTLQGAAGDDYLSGGPAQTFSTVERTARRVFADFSSGETIDLSTIAEVPEPSSALLLGFALVMVPVRGVKHRFGQCASLNA
jgi:Ca2+-binding RTX toxin-like protein